MRHEGEGEGPRTLDSRVVRGCRWRELRKWVRPVCWWRGVGWLWASWQVGGRWNPEDVWFRLSEWYAVRSWARRELELVEAYVQWVGHFSALVANFVGKEGRDLVVVPL